MSKRFSQKFIGILLCVTMALGMPFVPAATGMSQSVFAQEPAEITVPAASNETSPATEGTVSSGNPTDVTTTEPVPSTEPAAATTTDISPATDPTLATGETTLPAAEPTTATGEATLPATDPTTATGEATLPATDPTTGSLTDTATTDPVTNFVIRCYQLTLNRTPDASGLQYWVNGLKGHTTTAIQTAFGFVFSSEYLGKNPSKESFIDTLYLLMLNRTADAAGRTYWVDQMKAGASREAIFAGFANSVEFRGICNSYGVTQGYYSPSFPVTQSSQVTAFALRLYTICLGRSGDNVGVSDWTRQLIEGHNTGVGVAYGFFFSPEFLNLSYKPEDYISILYRTLLGREPDEAGLSYWGSRINNGESKESIFAGFANSAEFTAICKQFGISRGTYEAPKTGGHYFVICLPADEIQLYTVAPAYQSKAVIPSDLLKSYQITVLGTPDKPTYKVTDGESVTVDANGLVSPVLQRIYWIKTSSGYYYSSDTPGDGPDDFYTEEYKGGYSYIDVSVDGKVLTLVVYVDDYLYTFADQKIDDFIRDNTVRNMTTYQKVDAACRFVAQFTYDERISDSYKLIVGGKGNYDANNYLLMEILYRLQIEYRSNMNLSDDYGNVLVNVDGVSYIADFGNASANVNYYSFTKVADFQFNADGTGGAYLSHYNGFATDVTVPSSYNGLPVTAIGEKAFYESRVTRVVLPNTVTKIGDSAFKYCYYLSSITLSSNLKSIGSYAFCACGNLTGITFPQSLTTLGNQSFYYCSKIKTLILPNSMTTIPLGAFSYCTSLQSVVLPSNLNVIVQQAFYGCSALTSVTIPGKTTKIEGLSFAYCTSLKTIDIPASVTTIGPDLLKGSTQASIRGTKGSYAETYAKSKSIPFIAIA